MREDLREILEKHYTNGYYLFGILPNGTVDVVIENPNKVEGLTVIGTIVQAVYEENQESWKWLGKDDKPIQP